MAKIEILNLINVTITTTLQPFQVLTCRNGQSLQMKYLLLNALAGCLGFIWPDLHLSPPSHSLLPVELVHLYLSQ